MTPSLTLSAASERLPIGALLALAMTGFICIVTETLPAGLLPLISEGLAISPSMAGQMVTAYALGSVLAVIPMTIATRGWRRRNVLLLTIVGFLLFNSITALSSHYGVTLVARFFAGVAAGLAWSLLAGYARRMVAPHQQGKALALAMVGTPIALSLGVPLGTWLGGLVGWRTAFGLMSGLTLVLIVWVLVKVPDYPPQPAHQRLSLRSVLTTPGVRPVLAVVISWMLAHNILYTYIAPFVASAGLGSRVDLVLLVFGIAALVGIWLTAKLVEPLLRKTVLVSLAAFAAVCVVFGFLGTCRGDLHRRGGVGIELWRRGDVVANRAGGCGGRWRGCGVVVECGGMEQRDCRQRRCRRRIAGQVGRRVFSVGDDAAGWLSGLPLSGGRAGMVSSRGRVGMARTAVAGH